MARMTRTTLALVAIAAVAPLTSEAQDWTSQNINGQTVWDRAGQAGASVPSRCHTVFGDHVL